MNYALERASLNRQMGERKPKATVSSSRNDLRKSDTQKEDEFEEYLPDHSEYLMSSEIDDIPEQLPESSVDEEIEESIVGESISEFAVGSIVSEIAEESIVSEMEEESLASRKRSSKRSQNIRESEEEADSIGESSSIELIVQKMKKVQKRNDTSTLLKKQRQLEKSRLLADSLYTDHKAKVDLKMRIRLETAKITEILDTVLMGVDEELPIGEDLSRNKIAKADEHESVESYSEDIPESFAESEDIPESFAESEDIPEKDFEMDSVIESISSSISAFENETSDKFSEIQPDNHDLSSIDSSRNIADTSGSDLGSLSNLKTLSKEIEEKRRLADQMKKTRKSEIKQKIHETEIRLKLELEVL
jgi:hypothetical protein